tara:strand:+ start:83 stop:3700 length:3618 start_codon:yes stop_codon:yes gene_type:complete
MKLRKLVVSGFKSFADKVTVNFDDGITGIVGPNGSGKSNVIDSVRWVMGEQNAKNLRGQVATDIIFAGSPQRKALGLAEVTLVFDNSEEDELCPIEYRHEAEIALTRRLYIDGTREYLINKKPCRLKDIVGFFAASGLSGRSYAMIQQGQVDRILNAKPEDIREILEEAAGTLIYKNRRLAAKKKLERTSENLSRIEDIVAELSVQLEALEGQVEKAKKWQKLSDDLKSQEISLFAHNHLYLENKLIEAQVVLTDQQDQEVSLMTQLGAIEANHTELQNQLIEMDPESEALQEKASTLREYIARAESTITLAMQTLEKSEERLLVIDQEAGEDKDLLNKLEVEQIAFEKELQEADEESEVLKEQIEAYQDQVDQVDESRQVFENRLTEMRDTVRNIDHLLESNTLRFEAVDRDRKRATVEIESTQNRVQSLSSDVDTSEQSMSELQEKISTHQSGLDDEVLRKQSLDQEVSAKKEELQVRVQQRDELKEKYLGLDARNTSLRELGEDSSDIRQSVKELTQLNPELNDRLEGVLTSFLSFNERIGSLKSAMISSFEKWAERLVFSNLDDFVVFSESALEQNIGGFSASVLSLAQTLGRGAKAWSADTKAMPLQDFLELESSLEGLQDIVSRMYYLPEGKLSEKQISDLPAGMILFCWDGLVIKEQDEFLIGTPNHKGALSRKAEMEELAGELQIIDSDIQENQIYIDEIETDLAAIEAELADIEEKFRSNNQETLQVMGDLQSATQSMEHKQELLTEASKQYERYEEALFACNQELEELGETRNNLGKEREKIVADLENLESESDEYNEQFEEVQRLHQNRVTDLAKYEAKHQVLQDRASSGTEQVERIQVTLGRKLAEKEKIDHDKDLALENKISAEQEVEEYLAQREAVEEAIAVRREQNSGLMEDIRKAEATLKKVRDKGSKTEKAKNKSEMEIERLKIAIHGLRDQAEEKYQLKLKEHEFSQDENFDATKASRKVSSLRQSLEQMGAINMVAIEEHKKLSERYSFIGKQREEILGSIILLEDAISEIEESAKIKFLETFKVINLNFEDLFPILFPGGEAKLELESEGDPLSAGVEIMVRLPGKKRQRMNLFSGGEKALTAISLIFALLKTKPAPFCFLDEVDAPLDEANVGRYNVVLEALADRFQFVVITHNRRTMEVLDQLYGVTMQEGGVSKVVGVDMKKDIPVHLRKAFKETKQGAVAT